MLIVCALEAPNFSIFASKNQSLTVSKYTVDSISKWRIWDIAEEFSTHSTNDYVSRSRCHNKLHFVDCPAVASINRRHFIPTVRSQLWVNFFEVSHPILQLVILEDIWSCEDHNRVLNYMCHWNLKHLKLYRVDNWNVNLGFHLFLFPEPQDQTPVSFAAKSHNVLRLWIWAKDTGEELFAFNGWIFNLRVREETLLLLACNLNDLDLCERFRFLAHR